MIIVWLFVLRWQKMVWKIYWEVWKNEDSWVKNSTFHNRCHDNKGWIVTTPPAWLHYTIKTCVIGMPVTMFLSSRCICGVSAGVSPSSFHTSRTLPTPTMSSPASPRPPSCGGSCLWVREREREGGCNHKNYDCLLTDFFKWGFCFQFIFYNLMFLVDGGWSCVLLNPRARWLPDCGGGSEEGVRQSRNCWPEIQRWQQIHSRAQSCAEDQVRLFIRILDVSQVSISVLLCAFQSTALETAKFLGAP